MAQEIFRHDAVEKLSSPTQLNRLLIVVRLRGWIALFTLALLVFGIVIWSFIGTIPIVTAGRGILLAPNAQSTINSPIEGMIQNVYVKAGDPVSKGEPLVEFNAGEVIFAMEDGKVFQLESGKGEQVKKGQVLMWFQRAIHPDDLEIFAFIPIKAGERVKKGMEATVDLGAVDSQKYGQLVGQVKEVVPYAVSKDTDRLRAIPSKKLREELTENGAVILVIIEPKLASQNRSEVAWTFGKGPPEKLHPGSLGTVRITIENKKPISYLIPGLG